MNLNEMSMTMNILLLANIAPHPSMKDALIFQTTGFVLVILILTVLYIIVECVGFVVRVVESQLGAKAPALTPETMAVIGAALHTVIHDPHEIAKIEEVKSGSSPSR
jgi:hypothetical protein